ncbi:uncharacterized protein PV07_05623 [Cladophialophora immunda]|uniref:Uncharacterized protein n=1 Tax=Cladophialophora immunda TaxID=569365 RepID=A0A0D1ZPB5_9EURO|nr:uncharacterized protein PV07_05623 [Cladophialophora immunda]KIW29836.1 hypothetical protein PV07_05623 [Cladophialophora immunda]
MPRQLTFQGPSHQPRSCQVAADSISLKTLGRPRAASAKLACCTIVLSSPLSCSRLLGKVEAHLTRNCLENLQNDQSLGVNVRDMGTLFGVSETRCQQSLMAYTPSSLTHHSFRHRKVESQKFIAQKTILSNIPLGHSMRIFSMVSSFVSVQLSRGRHRI